MKKVTIIGAGIAGLSVRCSLQMNDYGTIIFEAHNDLKDSSDALRKLLHIL
jgi:2-polyprenyl-6-methoxyphenol hydroxylase-like FAD-dependent oxidoreductase